MDAGELSFRMGFSLSQKPHLAAGGGGLKAYRTRLANVVTWAGAGGGVRLALSNRDGKGEAEARCLHGRCDGSVVRGGEGVAVGAGESRMAPRLLDQPKHGA